MSFCAFFDFCYSVNVFIWYTPECTPQRIPFWLDSLFKFADRFIAYYIWLYPLLHTFWPSVRRKDERDKYKQTVKFLRSDSIEWKKVNVERVDPVKVIMSNRDYETPVGMIYDTTPNVELESEDDDLLSEQSIDDERNNFTGKDGTKQLYAFKTGF
jgi:hypothetical protein